LLWQSKNSGSLGSQGIKTDLWLTADKEVLPFTGQNPELKWEALRKQKGF